MVCVPSLVVSTGTLIHVSTEREFIEPSWVVVVKHQVVTYRSQ